MVPSQDQNLPCPVWGDDAYGEADKVCASRIRDVEADHILYCQTGIMLKKPSDHIQLGVPSPEVRSIRPQDVPGEVKRLFARAERSLLLADNSLSLDVFADDARAALLNALTRGVGFLCVSGAYVEGRRRYLGRSNPLLSVMDEPLCCGHTSVPALMQFYQIEYSLDETVLARDGEEVLTYGRDESGRIVAPRVFTWHDRVRVSCDHVFEHAGSSQSRLSVSPGDYVYGSSCRTIRHYAQLRRRAGPVPTADAAGLEELFDAFIRQRQDLIGEYHARQDGGRVDWHAVESWVDHSLALDREYFGLVKATLLDKHLGKYAAVSFGCLLGVAESESSLLRQVRTVYPKTSLYVGRFVPEEKPETSLSMGRVL